jgi:hypothetical protein
MSTSTDVERKLAFTTIGLAPPVMEISTGPPMS